MVLKSRDPAITLINDAGSRVVSPTLKHSAKPKIAIVAIARKLLVTQRHGKIKTSLQKYLLAFSERRGDDVAENTNLGV